MLQNFFRLNPGAIDVTSQLDLVNLTSLNDTVDNIIYRPNNLSGSSDIHKLKLKFITFENVSFKDTKFENVEFTNCHFEDCLFLGAKFIKCKFLECSFNGCNTLGLSIEKTYLNPYFFSGNFKFNHYTKSNIAVQLFQELYNNSVQQDYSEFAKKAKYYLLLWEDKLLISKFFFNKPYPIKWYKFYSHFIPNSFFRFGFGYGFRLRNFIISFILIFVSCFICNKHYWARYSLVYVVKINETPLSKN